MSRADHRRSITATSRRPGAQQRTRSGSCRERAGNLGTQAVSTARIFPERLTSASGRGWPGDVERTALRSARRPAARQPVMDCRHPGESARRPHSQGDAARSARRRSGARSAVRAVLFRPHTDNRAAARRGRSRNGCRDHGSRSTVRTRSSKLPGSPAFSIPASLTAQRQRGRSRSRASRRAEMWAACEASRVRFGRKEYLQSSVRFGDVSRGIPEGTRRRTGLPARLFER